MPVDNSIQVNGHNSFKVDVIQRSYPFGVEGHSHLTVHFSAWATSSLAEGLRGATLFFNADGMRIERRTHVWSVPSTGFEQVVITQAIPEGAAKAQFEFLPNGTYWIVEPKGEFGEIASPFNINFSNQLSQIGPTGAYLGLLHANQIILTGTQADPGERLNTRITTLNNRVLSMSSTLSGHGSRLTTIEAGQIVLSDDIDNNAWNITNLSSKQVTLTNTVSQKTTKITSAGIYTGDISANQITAGTLRSANGHSSINMANGTFNFGNGALTWSGGILRISGELESVNAGLTARVHLGQFKMLKNGKEMLNLTSYVDNANNAAFLVMGHGASSLKVSRSDSSGGINADFITFSRSGTPITLHGDANITGIVHTGNLKARDTGGIHFWDSSNRHRGSFYDDGGFLIRDRARERINVYGDNRGMNVYDNLGRLRFSYDANTSYMLAPNGNSLGVDSGGAYQVKSGVKTYL